MFKGLRYFLKKKKIPKNLERWKYAPDGITKIPIDEQSEINLYYSAREKEKKRVE